MKKKTPKLVAGKVDGKDCLFITVKSSLIDPLCLVIDGIPIVYFGKENTAYLAIETAIKWYENELVHQPKSERLKNNLNALISYRLGFDNGQIKVEW